MNPTCILNSSVSIHIGKLGGVNISQFGHYSTLLYIGHYHTYACMHVHMYLCMQI